MSDDAPSARIRYKPRREKLSIADDGILDRIFAVALLRPTQAEAAAALGVSRETLRLFMDGHPEAREAWDDGKQACKLSLRRTLMLHAKSDPGTARFLAKQYLKMSDDPAKARLDSTTEGVIRKQMSVAEAQARILELRAKLVPPPPPPMDKPANTRQQKRANLPARR